MAELRLRADPLGSEPAAWVSKALEELDCAHEELRSAEEELYAQAQELTVTYEALDSARARYQDLFESAPEAYVVTDCAGLIQECNRQACEMFNIDAAFVQGKPLALFLAEAERAALRETCARVGGGARDVGVELQIVPRHSDAAVWVAASVSRAAPAGDRGPWLRWLFRDVTLAREELRQNGALRAALEQKVRERTDELEAAKRVAEDNLRREHDARLRSDQAVQQRDALLAAIAHELRTPLHSIAGWLEVLQAPSTVPGAQQRAQRALSTGVHNLRRLIDELVDNARAERSLLRVDRASIELSAIVTRIVEEKRADADASGIKLSLAGGQLEPVWVLGDAFRLEQVLHNLVANAFKFTPWGGWVEVRLHPGDGLAHVSVRDSGRGIAAHDLPRIFQPFVQLRATTDAPLGGLGLGLSIARSIMELHDGGLDAESPGEGQGTTFHAWLPLLDRVNAE